MPDKRFTSKKKPLVLVTGPDKKLKWGWWASRFILRVVGLRAHYLTPRRSEVPEGVCGVIIGGGDDIEPEHYGLTGDAGAEYDRARDELEMSVVRSALYSKVPIMGICRGSQLINIVHGGNLHQDLRPKRKRTPNRNSIFPIKWADLEEGSRLRAIFSAASIRINSLHNQAVDTVGKGFVVTARDRDGFTQAIEFSGDRFMVGVQWHPEYMPWCSQQRQLFHNFADAVRQCDDCMNPQLSAMEISRSSQA